MTTRLEPGVELLHRVFGAVEVARDLIDRSTGLYCRDEAGRHLEILAGLVSAAEALGAVAAALEDELQDARIGIGPAA